MTGDVATEAMRVMHGQLWDCLLPVLALAYTDGASPMPPKPWAEQPPQVQAAFIMATSDGMLGVANYMLTIGEE